MTEALLQAVYDTNTPERIERARQEVCAYSPEARAELDAETQWLLDRHPEGLTREAAGYVAWVRLRNGASRYDQHDREVEVALDVDEGLARRDALLRLLAREEETHADDPWPFRRHVELDVLESTGRPIQATMYRALLDLIPRAHWDAAMEAAGRLGDSWWERFDRERQQIVEAHPWLVHPEGDVLAWGKMGDFREGFSGTLLFLAGQVGKAARETSATVLR